MTREIQLQTQHDLANALNRATEDARTASGQRDNSLRNARKASEALEIAQARQADLRWLLRTADPEHADRYADPQPDAQCERERRLGDYRALIEFWETHPQVPVGDWDTVYLNGSDELTAADVEAYAALLGVPTRITKDGRMIAAKRFGTAIELHLSAPVAAEPAPLPVLDADEQAAEDEIASATQYGPVAS